jgi:hypothetical protein
METGLKILKLTNDMVAPLPGADKAKADFRKGLEQHNMTRSCKLVRK